MDCKQCQHYGYNYYEHKKKHLHICIPDEITLEDEEVEETNIEDKPYFCKLKEDS